MITGNRTAFEREVAGVFTREGYKVFFHDEAREKEIDKLDYLFDTTDYRDPADHFTIEDGFDGTVVEAVLRENVLRPMALLERYLPLLEAGEGKRLVYLSSASASINETRSVRGFGYNMSKAALHQFIQLTRNKLGPKGYTFRVFDPQAGEVPPQAAAEAAFNYITRRRGTENHDPRRDDEENLVIRDAMGRQHGW
jgi:NAD(P)-dependent dehydrogenase (short-subunit alcohol dehydrogenase family)